VVGPGEADGLAAMVKIFNAQYPNIKFVNAAVAGGAGTNAKAVLAPASRLVTRPIPGSSRRPGTIATYVTPGQVKPLDDLFASTALALSCPRSPAPDLKDGHPYRCR